MCVIIGIPAAGQHTAASRTKGGEKMITELNTTDVASRQQEDLSSKTCMCVPSAHFTLANWCYYYVVSPVVIIVLLIEMCVVLR